MDKLKYFYFDHTNESDALRSLDLIGNLTRINYDQETTGLNPENINERLRLLQFGNFHKQFLYDIWRVSDRVKDRIVTILESDIEKVIHNAVFDVKFARADLGVLRFGKLWCTMLAEQIIACGNLNYGFSLEDVTIKHLGFKPDKEMQRSDWSVPKLSEKQLVYAASDVRYLGLIADKQKEILEADGTLQVAIWEFECAEPVATMELNGFYLNAQKWKENVSETQKKAEILGEELAQMLAPENQMLFGGTPSFNINSTQEITKRLEYLGVALPEVNGKTTTNKTKLANMRNKPKEIVKLIEYREQQTQITKYGPPWLDFISPTTGRIHSSYKQNGAKTGRFSDTKPPKQQIPKKGRQRNCFEAQGDGNSLVWGDYSQFELRVVAEIVYNLTGDTTMIEAFERGDDYHQFTASQIFDIPMDEVTDEERNPSKNMNFLMVYGGGKYKLAENVKISVERAGWIIERFFEVIPALKTTLDWLAKTATKEEQSKTLGGRLLKHVFNKYDGKERARVERIGKNMPVQGTNADVLKIALRLLHNLITDSKIKLVHIVHDEIVLECPDYLVDEAKRILREVMEQAGKVLVKRCPVKVDVKSGKFWSK